MDRIIIAIGFGLGFGFGVGTVAGSARVRLLEVIPGKPSKRPAKALTAARESAC